MSKKNKSKAKKQRQSRENIPVAYFEELQEAFVPVQEEIEQFHIYCEAEDRMYGYSPTRMAMLTMDWQDKPFLAPPVVGPVISNIRIEEVPSS